MDVKSSSCKRRRISHVTKMRIIDLPWVILIEILSRLSIKPIFRFTLPSRESVLVGLCNGFTCFVNDLTNIEKHFISVCRVTCGFCFSKASGKYKILRFLVYTLGVGEKWRNLDEILCPVWYKFDKVNINGALHWMDSKKNDIIYSFDIETEKVKSLPAPPGLINPPWNLKLVELGNYLCLTDYYNTLSTNIDIWLMKEYGVSES
ncbi:hypothetical protein R3W88_013649 [Solanum pinnatisectum]|uniref:F-box associated beta-propeller type 1 domain-containing protein n=1 Tax=Solanum pinnatisectum TaxID=50273 RepID=A0AAV9KPU6_9SOLN|nr:hypothetical protein R3W88_013649 [Solanum pinnatisectum]